MQEYVPTKVGLLELLYGSQGGQNVIPACQRNYTWTANEEVRQLCILNERKLQHFQQHQALFFMARIMNGNVGRWKVNWAN